MRGEKRIDLTGLVFNRLTVIKFSHTTKRHEAMWECKCICGNIIITRSQNLRENRTGSCGCLSKEILKTNGLTHGHSLGAKKSLTLVSWTNMKQRCYNPNTIHFERYGGRGITVCQRWLESFENFLEDMGERPTKQHTLDRVRRNGNYTKRNCRWATKKEQSGNTSRNKWFTYNGKKIIQADFCRIFGIAESNFIGMQKTKSLKDTILFYEKKYKK